MSTLQSSASSGAMNAMNFCRMPSAFCILSTLREAYKQQQGREFRECAMLLNQWQLP
jgi:hypothetical protein